VLQGQMGLMKALTMEEYGIVCITGHVTQTSDSSGFFYYHFFSTYTIFAQTLISLFNYSLLIPPTEFKECYQLGVYWVHSCILHLYTILKVLQLLVFQMQI
jgi:hypothetical protein